MFTSYASKHFSAKTIRGLARKGITVLDTVLIPGQGDLPCANGETGYGLSDNGTYKVRTFLDVLALAE